MIYEHTKREQNIKTDQKMCPKVKITVASREGQRAREVAKRDFGFC